MAEKLEIREGQRFSRLIVLYEESSERKPSGNLCRVFKVKCDCGKEISVRLENLRSGNTKSCGCLSKDIKTKHGLHGTRVYKCWDGMKQRVRIRENCGLYPPWEDFENFHKWAKFSGYTDDLILCRNGDKGDYEPDNCRWATAQENLEEAQAKFYTIVHPCGKVEEVFNLAKFARENKYKYSSLFRVLNGTRSSYKGIKITHKEA